MNVFDIIGPVMIGPSSSHTAGVVRIGRIAAILMQSPVQKAHILLHGSFARTYQGHGTDKALVGGILKMEPWDTGIRTSLEKAKELGMEIVIEKGEIDGAHPNTALLTLTGRNGEKLEVQGASVGGGNILITGINGMDVQFSGQRDTLLIFHQDVPGAIAGVTALVAKCQANICQFRLNRKEKGKTALMVIETDTAFEQTLLTDIKNLPYVENAVWLTV